MNIPKFLIYFIIGFGFCIISIWVIYDITKHKKLFSFENMKMERNRVNERYEILPDKNTKLHASIPIKQQHTQSPYVGNKSLPNSANGVLPNYPKNKSTFCTCGGLIDENCVNPADRINSYNSGLTELSKLPDKHWYNVMPYDQFIKQPNDQQNTNWQDIMPYDMYESQF